MASPVPVLGASNGIDNLLKLFQVVAPALGGKSTETTTAGSNTSSSTESSSISPEANDQSNELLKKIMGDSNSGDIDNMIQGILQNAKNAFGPAAIESNFAGVRGYSDTTLASLRNDAMAKAVAQSAQAKLQAINQANQTASGLVESKIANTRSVQQTKTTATAPVTRTTTTPVSNAAKVGGGLSAAALAYSLLKKNKGAAGDVAKGSEGVSGMADSDYGRGITSDFDSGFQASQEGGVSLDAFGGPGADVNELLAASRTDVAASNSPLVDPELAGDAGNTITAPDGGISADPGATMPPAVIDPSLVITPDTSSTADILASQGIPTGSAMPAAMLPGASMPAAPIPGPDLLGDAENATGELTDAVDVIPSDLSSTLNLGNIQVADSGQFTTDVGGGLAGDSGEFAGGAELSTEAGGDFAGEAVADFALPPGTFTIANAISGGELGNAVNDVVGAVPDAVSDVGNAATDAVEGAGEAVTNFFDSPNVFTNGINSLGDTLGDAAGGVFDFFDDFF